jgi:hypothetical protein
MWLLLALWVTTGVSCFLGAVLIGQLLGSTGIAMLLGAAVGFVVCGVRAARLELFLAPGATNSD